MYVRRAISIFVVFVLGYLSILRLVPRDDNGSLGDSILAPPNRPFHITNPPSPGVVDFWAKWADIFDEGRPHTPPIKVKNKMEMSQTTDVFIPENDDRTPTPVSIGLPEDDIESMRDSHQVVLDYLRMDNTQEDALKLFNGTGIVTVAGGWYYGPALVSIRMLRKTNSTLPVQVFLQSASEYEPHICEEVLPALNAECFVIEDFLRREAPFKVTRFQLKVLAIIFSSFERVLFLDSDCIPLHDPSILLESEPFLTYGFVSWPDYWIATEDPAFYTIAGFPAYPTGLPLRSSEAGQLLISKHRHISSLLLSAYYNVFGPTHYYPLLSQGAPGEGDKDTFLAAIVARNESYYRVKTKTGSIGIKDHAGNFHGRGMVQYDVKEEYELQQIGHHAKPRPFFIHANTPKMNVARLLEKDILFMPYTGAAKERTRLWGTKDKMLRQYDFDVEKVVWEEMVDMACTLGTIIKDFKKKRRVCEKAKEHWNAVFADDGNQNSTKY